MEAIRMWLVGGMLGALAAAASGAGPDSLQIKAQIQVESKGNDQAIGDKHLSQRAYGCLQVRQPCVDDVNRAYGTHYRAEDCLGNRALSVEIYKKYLRLYATRKALGREPTRADFARIWNGGPNGWRSALTRSYWAKVQLELKEQG